MRSFRLDRPKKIYCYKNKYFGTTMTADDYLDSILRKYAVNVTGAEQAGQIIYPTLQKWGNGYLVSADFSGSLKKGTAISLGTDADIFLSVAATCPGTLSDLYQTLFNAVSQSGYPVRKQNVSIGTTVNGYNIDLVPARIQAGNGNTHSLYRSKSGSWSQTNVQTHIQHIASSGRTAEIKLAKIWRNLHSLDFPSFYLELAVIAALHYARAGNLAANFMTVLEYFRDNLVTARFVDPANTNNVISDELTTAEKQAIARQAGASRCQPTWGGIVW